MNEFRKFLSKKRISMRNETQILVSSDKPGDFAHLTGARTRGLPTATKLLRHRAADRRGHRHALALNPQENASSQNQQRRIEGGCYPEFAMRVFGVDSIRRLSLVVEIEPEKDTSCVAVRFSEGVIGDKQSAIAPLRRQQSRL
jgi:hypothetical protein